MKKQLRLVQHKGNSGFITIPKEFLKPLGLEEDGTAVSIAYDEDNKELIVKKVNIS